MRQKLQQRRARTGRRVRVSGFTEAGTGFNVGQAATIWEESTHRSTFST